MATEKGYGNDPAVMGLIAVVMFLPAISVVITQLITKEGFKNPMIKPNFKGNWKYYVAAWFGPQILCVIGAAVYFLIFPDRFDPSHSYIHQLYADKGVKMTPEMMNMTIISQYAMAFFLGPLLNSFACFGEEWGWRGYMMPKMMEKIKFLPAVLIGGLIWGLWHAPLIALGHNYGTDYAGAPWSGIAMMSLFCIVLGCIFTYLSNKTGSVWPAVIGHGAINGFAAAPLYFIADNTHTLLGPSSTGLIGMSALIIVAIIICIKQRN